MYKHAQVYTLTIDKGKYMGGSIRMSFVEISGNFTGWNHE